MERAGEEEEGTGWRVERVKVGDFMEETWEAKASRQGASVDGTEGIWEVAEGDILREDMSRLESLGRKLEDWSMRAIASS